MINGDERPPLTNTNPPLDLLSAPSNEARCSKPVTETHANATTSHEVPERVG